MFDPRKHNYYKKLLQLAEQLYLRPGCLHEVDIYHDDWCALHRGGYCNCDPDVEYRGPHASPEWN